MTIVVDIVSHSHARSIESQPSQKYLNILYTYIHRVAVSQPPEGPLSLLYSSHLLRLLHSQCRPRAMSS